MDKKILSNTAALEKTQKKIRALNKKISQLYAENIQLNNLIETLPGDIYWKNTEGIWLGMNSRCAQSLQRMGFIRESDKAHVLGKTDHQIFDKKTADGLRQMDLEVMEKRMELSREEVTYLPSGEQITLHSTKAPLWDKEGHIAGIVGNTIDITHLKKIEQELKNSKEVAETANHAKTAFLANMRHDIRTPLSGIVGFSEIIKSAAKEVQIKEYADHLVASSHALLELMDEVLEAIKVSSGDIPRLKIKFNLAQIFEHIIALYRAKAEQKKLNLSLNIDKKLPRFVIGDKTRIHRIALELVGNALNFTDKGQVSLEVALAKKEDRHLVIKIVVTDTGVGIPKDKQQEVYVQFNRLTPSYQNVHKGAGLGLYVVKQFIEELDGEIYVESELRKGTRFTCLLPVQAPLLDDVSGIEKAQEAKTTNSFLTDEAQFLKSSPEKTDLQKTKNMPKVLVVEDNPIAQSVTKTLLSMLFCQVDIASDGNEALSLCQKNQYHLIFMDIGLGTGMDGYEVTRQIRKRANHSSCSPIIALSAHEGEENKQRSMEAGMNAVLSKPLTLEHATQVLQKFVPAPPPPPQKEPITPYDLPLREEDMFHLEQFALLDSELGLKNCGNLNMLIQLLTIIVNDIPQNLEQMKKAYESQNYNQIEKIAHSFKGSAVYVGTTRMKYACQYVERYWKSGKRQLFDQLYHQAVHTLEESCSYITNWLKEHKAL